MKRWPEFRIAVGMDEKGYYWIEKRGTARQFAGDPKNTNRDYNSWLRGVAREQEQKASRHLIKPVYGKTESRN